MRTLAILAGLGASLSISSFAYAQDLQPPPAAPQPAAQEPSATEADLKKSDEEDSGLGLEWVYLNAGGGFSYLDMKSFSESQLAVTDSSKSGGMYTFGAGVRLLFLTLGARATNHTAFNLWQIDADVGLHMRISRIDGYLAFRGGYDTVGSFSESVSTTQSGVSGSAPSIDVHGWDVGAAFGLDYYFSHLVSLGAEVGGQVLFLKRPPLPPPTAANLPAGIPQAQQQQALAELQKSPLYANSGSSVGFGATGGLHLGIHF